LQDSSKKRKQPESEKPQNIKVEANGNDVGLRIDSEHNYKKEEKVTISNQALLFLPYHNHPRKEGGAVEIDGYLKGKSLPMAPFCQEKSTGYIVVFKEVFEGDNDALRVYGDFLGQSVGCAVLSWTLLIGNFSMTL
jgi:hypothetical protein